MQYKVDDHVQIINHSEPRCNGQYGTVTSLELAYNGRIMYYMVTLDYSNDACLCSEDEMMEG